MKKPLMLLVLLAVPSLAATGYLPQLYVGKCDPWPGNVPLPNEQLRECHINRYGVEPGYSAARVGYCCELFWVNFDALKNWCHVNNPSLDCNATTTEATDLSFSEPRGGQFIYEWYVKRSAGGTPENRLEAHFTDKPCGALTLARTFLDSYNLYVNNTPPCGTLVPSPEPPPPVTCTYAGCSECGLSVTQVPPEVLSVAQQIPGWGSGWWSQKWKESVRNLAIWLSTFKPAIQSTGSMPCVVKTLP